MSARLRYVALTAARTRAVLPPRALLVAAAAIVLTFVFLAFPLALVALGVANEFKPAVTGADVAAGVLAHLCCAALGGAIGVVFAPPRLTRRATAVAAVVATLLALVAIEAVLGPVGGPVAVAQALSDANDHPVDGAVLVACLSCVVLAAAALAAADRWARRAG